MNIFRLHTEKQSTEARDTRTWLVVADSLLNAVSLLPEGFYVKAAEIERIAVVGPVRVIGCLVSPTIH
jgi:hypothetical protein